MNELKERHNELRKKEKTYNIINLVLLILWIPFIAISAWVGSILMIAVAFLYLIIFNIFIDVTSKRREKDKLKFKLDNKDNYVDYFIEDYLSKKNMQFKNKSNYDEGASMYENNKLKKFTINNVDTLLSLNIKEKNLYYVVESRITVSYGGGKYKEIIYFQGFIITSDEKIDENAVNDFNVMCSNNGLQKAYFVNDILVIPAPNFINTLDKSFEDLHSDMKFYDEVLKLVSNI